MVSGMYMENISILELRNRLFALFDVIPQQELGSRSGFVHSRLEIN